MIRLLFRAIGLVFLAAALAAIVVDAARSIAGSALTLTAVGPAWFGANAESFVHLQEFVKVTLVPSLGGWVWDPLTTSILALPASVVLAVLGLACLAIGAPRRRRRKALA
jgi:hypothetical protein